jgi:uncharacterized protein (DUF1810 family)
MTDPFNLHRFVAAQEGVYESVRSELRAGLKRGHWMWYIFPQIQGLGRSAMSQTYAIGSRDEAKAYAEHPVLGRRLRECTQLVMAVQGRTATQIFSSPDDLKFRSCMTLFEKSAAESDLFRAALLEYFDGEPDPLTLGILSSEET